MSLTQKLALTMLLPALVALAASAALRIPREAQLFVADMQRDHETSGAALAAAVEEVWENEGEERALDVLGDAVVHAGIRAVHLSADQIGGGHAPLDDAEQARLMRGWPVSRVVDIPGRIEDVATYVPLRPHGRIEGALLIRESLGARQSYLIGSLARTLLVLVVVTFFAGIAAWHLGRSLFARPVRRMLEHARRIGEGRFARVEYPARGDELGELQGELNEMCARLDDARARLEEENRDRLTALEQLRHAERLTTVGKLASGVAHELGTPLHVVIARAKRIAKRAGDADSVHDAESIEREGKRMSRLIKKLLELARPQSPRLVHVELGALARETAALLRPMADARHVSLEVHANGEAAGVEADKDGLVQVLTNLVMNGIQATGPGHRVELAVRSPVSLVRDGEERCFARVVVSDEGHGIPGPIKERIFEPFFTTRDVGEGTGLGLSVAWGIVREHGGFIDVESEPGSGARFVVHLPLVRGATRVEPASAA